MVIREKSNFFLTERMQFRNKILRVFTYMKYQSNISETIADKIFKSSSASELSEESFRVAKRVGELIVTLSEFLSHSSEMRNCLTQSSQH